MLASANLIARIHCLHIVLFMKICRLGSSVATQKSLFECESLKNRLLVVSAATKWHSLMRKRSMEWQINLPMRECQYRKRFPIPGSVPAEMPYLA